MRRLLVERYILNANDILLWHVVSRLSVSVMTSVQVLFIVCV